MYLKIGLGRKAKTAQQILSKRQAQSKEKITLMKHKWKNRLSGLKAICKRFGKNFEIHPDFEIIGK